MANNRILAVVTLLMLAATSGKSQQDPSLEQLLTIDKLISDGNWYALYVFIEENPQLAAGNDALAVELREFVDDVKRADLNQFDSPANVANTRNARSGNGGLSSIY